VRFEFDVTLLAVGNTPPEFQTPPVTEAAASRPYQYAAAAADADGDTLTYRLAAGPDFLSVDPHTGLVSGTPSAADVGTHQVELTAADGFGGTARQTFQLQVWAAIPNRPPIFKTVPGVQAEPDAVYVYAAHAEDMDGDVLRYTLDAAPLGMTVDEATGLVGWPQAAAGTHAVSLRVTDGRGGEAQQIFVLSIGSGTPNAAPQFNSSPPVRGLVGESYLYLAAVSDPDGGPPQFSLTQAPAGMTVDANTGLVQWQPTADQTGLQLVTLCVEDQHGGAAVQRWLIDVTSTSLNRPPLFVERIANPSLTQDEPSNLADPGPRPRSRPSPLRTGVRPRRHDDLRSPSGRRPGRGRPPHLDPHRRRPRLAPGRRSRVRPAGRLRPTGPVPRSPPPEHAAPLHQPAADQRRCRRRPPGLDRRRRRRRRVRVQRRRKARRA
jgi:hypothetical protein